MEIPLVELDKISPTQKGWQTIVKQIHESFASTGFIYIKSSLISVDLVDHVFHISKEFFGLSDDTKIKYIRKSDTNNNGYVKMQQERLNPKKPPDLKECFNFVGSKKCTFPKEVTGFENALQQLYRACLQVSYQLLEIMGYALGLKDPQFFVKCHQKVGEGPDVNFTTMRLLYYPPINNIDDIKPEQLRCGEHVDYGSITLLFQDENAGLQVKKADGSYINAPYLRGTVLVNLGALMQQWTCDQYLATPHRVLVPDDDHVRCLERQSIAFFLHPDNDTVIECIDGSNKYPPITAAEDIAKRFAKTY